MPDPTGLRRQAIRAECFILCDGAHAVGEKLYVLGGGWRVLNAPALPLPFTATLAVQLVIPWEDGNQQLPLRLDVVDDDGAAVVAAPLTAVLEVGRPIGLVPGDDIPFRFVMGAPLTLVKPTRIHFRLFVRDATVASTAFRVRVGPVGTSG